MRASDDVERVGRVDFMGKGKGGSGQVCRGVNGCGASPGPDQLTWRLEGPPEWVYSIRMGKGMRRGDWRRRLPTHVPSGLC